MNPTCNIPWYFILLLLRVFFKKNIIILESQAAQNKAVIFIPGSQCFRSQEVKITQVTFSLVLRD